MLGLILEWHSLAMKGAVRRETNAAGLVGSNTLGVSIECGVETHIRDLTNAKNLIFFDSNTAGGADLFLEWPQVTSFHSNRTWRSPVG